VNATKVEKNNKMNYVEIADWSVRNKHLFQTKVLNNGKSATNYLKFKTMIEAQRLWLLTLHKIIWVKV